MSHFRLAQQAKTDLREIWDYVAADNPAAVDRLIDNFYEKFRLIATQPLMGQSRKELGANLRSFSIGAYVAIFGPIDDGIEVVRVIHGARDVSGLF